MKRLLIATHVKFWLENQGSSRRISSMIDYLTRYGFEVHVYLSKFVKQGDVDKVRRRYAGLPLHFYADNYSGERLTSSFLLRNLSSVAKKISKEYRCGSFFGRPQPEGFDGKYAFYRRDLFRKICARVQPDSIIVEYISLAYLAEEALSSAHNRPLVMVDTHDILSLRSRSFKTHGLQHWVDITREEEIFYLSKFDVVIAIQERERETLAEMLPGKKVITVPYPSPVRTKQVTPKPPLKVVYVGADSPVNVSAISHFTAEVWPRLHARYGDELTLDIYGSVCDSLPPREPGSGIRQRGKFEHLEEVFQDADIAVNPVRSGGGLKIKNVEALCNAVPLVTTVEGARGLEEGLQRAAFLCCPSDDEQFHSLCRLVESGDERVRLSRNAYAFAQEHFTESRCYAELVALLVGDATSPQDDPPGSDQAMRVRGRPQPLRRS